MKSILKKIKELINKITGKIGDKRMRLLCSFIITILFGLINPVLGILLGCVAGLVKEFYDQFRYNKYTEGEGFSKSDLLYDIIGVALAIVILVVL